jgi:hypothetical protein
MLADDLTDLEQRVCEAFLRGEKVEVSPESPSDERDGTAGASLELPAVRAQVLTSLMLGLGRSAPGRAAALWVVGARIVGRFRLSFATVHDPMLLEDCVFEQRPELYWSKLAFTSFAGCHMPGLMASNATIDGHLWLNRCTITDEARLMGARIAGGLLLEAAQVRGSGSAALNAERIVLGGDLVCRDADFQGSFHIYHANVSGSIDLDRVRIAHVGDVAMGADSIAVEGGLYCREASVAGEVRLRHARINGALTFTGATLKNPGDVALRLDRANVEGGLYLLNGFRAEGEIRAVSTHIDRTFAINTAELQNPGGVALRADAVTIDGTLDGRDGLRVNGEFRIEDAAISGSVRLEGARLHNPIGVALSARGATVGSVFNCCDGFAAAGTVTLNSARVTSRLCFDNASLHTPDGEALKCWRLQAAELTTRWAHTPEGSVDLRHAHIGVVRDDPGTWPGKLQLDGLTYDMLDPPTHTSNRLAWISRDPDGSQRQPYERLAALMRANGDDALARALLLQRQRRQTRAAPWPARIWGYLQDVTVGYGYRPVHAALWFALLLATGTASFTAHHPSPVDPATAPQFIPAIYTLDLLLPLVDFGQQNAFSPSGQQQWLAYALIGAGLLLATTIAAGISRSLRRN